MDNKNNNSEQRLTREEYQNQFSSNENHLTTHSLDDRKQIITEKSRHLAKFLDKMIFILIILIVLVFLILFFVNF